MSSPRFSSYIVCTTPRSGSTLLCMLLATTKKAGSPGSHFHAPSLDQWFDAYGLTDARFATRHAALRAVFDAALRRGTGGTGVFGLRMQRGSFGYFMEQLDTLHPDCASDIDRIEAAFGPTLFVHLTRRDKLAQAVSRTMAEQTGLWHRAADGSELERLGPAREPRYDRKTIERHMAELIALDAAWEDWFAREEVDPLRIDYDALAADPRGVLAGVLDALGLDRTIAQGIVPPTAKLADATSRTWIERYRVEEHPSA